MSQSMVWKDITGFAFCWTVLLHLCAYTNSRQGESLGMMVMMWAYEYIFTILLVAIAIGNVFDDIYIVYVAGGIFILWWDIKVYRMRKNAH